MATIKVRIKVTHECVTPATTLETHVDGKVVQSFDIPETRSVRKAGDVFSFGSKKAARAFVEAVGADKAEVLGPDVLWGTHPANGGVWLKLEPFTTAAQKRREREGWTTEARA